MAARIFQRSRNAMQSGKARAGRVGAQFESHRPIRPDPLTGWSGGADTQAQVTLDLPDAGGRQGLCRARGHRLSPRPAGRAQAQLQSYADNFR